MVCNHPIIVIGAGAAGLLAAGRAAELGADVLLLEKMARPGLKILITGNGRCNLTNIRDRDSFMAQFGPNGRFLDYAFQQFFRDDLLTFLRRYGIETKVKMAGKVYPVSENARDIVRAFQRYLNDYGVTLRLGVGVTGLRIENGRVCGVSTPEGNIEASVVVLAAGGSSHPQTGSTGDGYTMAAQIGHTIVRLRPGLVPLVATLAEPHGPVLSGTLRDVRVTAFRCPSQMIDLSKIPDQDTGRGIAGGPPQRPVIESRRGDAAIVPFGVSGPVIWEISLAVIDALEDGPVSLSIDLRPDIDSLSLQAEFLSAFNRPENPTFQNIVQAFLPRRIVNSFISLADYPPDQPADRLSVEERLRCVKLIKSLRFDIHSAHSMATAMVTAGGVALNEIDPLTMQSRLVRGLYLCGEILDLDAGTGGYNLQAAFSTGFIAGQSAFYAIAR